MNITDFVINFSLLLISLTVAFCGYYVYLLIQDWRKVLRQTSAILDDTKLVSSSLASPFTSFAELFATFRQALLFVNDLLSRKKPTKKLIAKK